MAFPLKKAGLAAGGILALSAIGYFIYYNQVGRYFQTTNDAFIQADQVSISSKLSGYVARVPVSDNQRVAKAALLVEIDPVDYRTRLSLAEADANSARAAAVAARASAAEAGAGIAAAQAAVQSAQANFDYARRELERTRPLVEEGAESQARLSELISAHDRAAAELASRKAALAQANSRVESIGAQAAAQKAKAVAARTQQDAAANDLASTRLVAPIAGKVANKSVRIGQFVQPGVRLMTVVPDQDIYVVANFKETQVGLMRAGQPATIHIDALPGVEFTGKVTSVTPGTGANFSLIPPQNATGNFTKIVQRVPVRIRIDAGQAARRVLVPGLSLEVEVDTRAGRKELQEIRSEQEQARK